MSLDDRDNLDYLSILHLADLNAPRLGTQSREDEAGRNCSLDTCYTNPRDSFGHSSHASS